MTCVMAKEKKDKPEAPHAPTTRGPNFVVGWDFTP